MGTRSIIGRFQQTLSRSRWAVAVAIKLRNQCEMVIQYYLGEVSRPELNGERQLIDLVGPGTSTFIDVGANVGNWAELFLGACGSGTRGLLIDASSSAIAKLQDRFRDRQGLKIVRAAVSDSAGESEFYEEPEAGETSSLQRSASRPGAQAQRVRVTTVDQEAADACFEYVGMLKIDVEGYDFHVLRGAKHLLERVAVGLVQFEYNRPWASAGSTLSAAMSYLNSFGYQVYLLRSTGLHRLDYERYGEFFSYTNFVAISPEMLPKMRPLIRD
jgi:FkbM family methyltransferase